jgi:hypothetical protein
MNKISYANTYGLSKFLKWKGRQPNDSLSVLRFHEFPQYNRLVDINCIFSNCPFGQPLDRTGNVHLPVKYDTGRPWKYSTTSITLNDALAQRVTDLLSRGEKINLLWSGGIDSTTMVNAFLHNTTDFTQLRVLYSPFSLYEHREYLTTFLAKFPKVELIDISGDVYLTQTFDGIFVTGDTGDETQASIDESFLEEFGYDALNRPWRDFFYSKNTDPGFADFCEEYFAWSGRPIDTLLEARWWFYINSKMYCMLSIKLGFFSDYKNFTPSKLTGFFDCDEFENYITHNIDRLMTTPEYSSWKQDLKDYCQSIDGFDQWAKQKTKLGSFQFHAYTYKKTVLNDQRSIFILDNGTRIHTPGLPLLSQREFENCYGNTLDYLLNDPV